MPHHSLLSFMDTQLLSELLQKPSYLKRARNSNPKSHLRSLLIPCYHHEQQAKKIHLIHKNSPFHYEIDSIVATHEVEGMVNQAKKFSRLKRRRAAPKARGLPQLGFWCVKATISDILRKRKLSYQKLSATKRGGNISNIPKSHLQSFGYKQQHPLNHFVHRKIDLDDDEERNSNDQLVQRVTQAKRYGSKLKRRSREGVQGRKMPRLGLWFLTASISHVLRKARAFYNELCCDAYEEYEYRSRSPITLVDPYFSMPVITPCTTIFN